MLDDHVMLEDQVMLSLKGDWSSPDVSRSFRAGEARYERRGGRARQHSRAAEPRAGLEQQMRAMEAHIAERLAPFQGGRISLQSLIRRRRVPGVPNYRQGFAGFWGRLVDYDGQAHVLGGVLGSGLVFREGPWQDWSLPASPPEPWDERLPIVFSPYCTTLLHEALGHGLEADYLPDSPIARRQGRRLCVPPLTVMDCPSTGDMPGSMTHDDTGQVVSDTLLIHQGVLVGELNAEHAAWRRANFRSLPYPRATNFIVRAGDEDPEQWLRSLPDCYYVSWIQSGNWRPGGYRVRLLCGPVYRLHRGEAVSMSQSHTLELGILDLLDRLEAVGDDFRIDPVVHWCAKKNQTVPLGMASPSLLLGGRA